MKKVIIAALVLVVCVGCAKQYVKDPNVREVDQSEIVGKVELEQNIWHVIWFFPVTGENLYAKAMMQASEQYGDNAELTNVTRMRQIHWVNAVSWMFPPYITLKKEGIYADVAIVDSSKNGQNSNSRAFGQSGNDVKPVGGIDGPVIVSRAVVEKDVLGYPQARVSVFNKTDRRVKAIEVTFDIVDAFGRPVTGFGSTYKFVGVYQELIYPGEGAEIVWSLVVYGTAYKIRNPRITRVATE
jgi:hypothetical protein